MMMMSSVHSRADWPPTPGECGVTRRLQPTRCPVPGCMPGENPLSHSHPQYRRRGAAGSWTAISVSSMFYIACFDNKNKHFFSLFWRMLHINILRINIWQILHINGWYIMLIFTWHRLCYLPVTQSTCLWISLWYVTLAKLLCTHALVHWLAGLSSLWQTSFAYSTTRDRSIPVTQGKRVTPL